MKVEDILNDDSYPHKKSLDNILKRVRDISSYIVEEVEDDRISFKIRDMVFLYIEPLDDCVVSTENDFVTSNTTLQAGLPVKLSATAAHFIYIYFFFKNYN